MWPTLLVCLLQLEERQLEPGMSYAPRPARALIDKQAD